MGGGWLNMQMGPTSWIVVGTGAAAVGEIKRRPVPFDFLDQTKICNGRYLDMLSAFCRVPRGRPHLHIRPDDYLNFSDVGTGICHFKILSISILFSYPFVDAGGSSRLLRWIIHTRRGCMLSLRIPVIDTLCLCRRVRAEEIWGKKEEEEERIYSQMWTADKREKKTPFGNEKHLLGWIIFFHDWQQSLLQSRAIRPLVLFREVLTVCCAAIEFTALGREA